MCQLFLRFSSTLTFRFVVAIKSTPLYLYMYNITYKSQSQAIIITLSLFCTILHTIKQRSGNRAFHFTHSLPDLNFQFYILNFQFTLYPASSTALLRTESSTFFDIVRTAEPSRGLLLPIQHRQLPQEFSLLLLAMRTHHTFDFHCFFHGFILLFIFMFYFSVML